MTRLLTRFRAARVAVLAAAALPALVLAGNPLIESTSSGLLTFSSEDKALRVAIVMAERDEATVPTLVRFIDQRGIILKQTRGELQTGRPVIAQLTRADVGARADLLVRVEVLHKLPGVRDTRYPILVTTQPISLGGAARFVLDWNTGVCGCPTCGPPIGPGPHVDCDPESPTDI